MSNETITQLVAALDGKPSGSGWSCRCPAHEDQHASLSLTESNGKVLLHCHAGCSQEQVIEALRTINLWPAGDHRNGGRRREVARYTYENKDGQVIYEIVRFEPKDFRLFNPNTREWNAKGITRVPYHLPELLQGIADGRTVVIAEGEKDVDRLRSLGFLSTCNPGGCGSQNLWHQFAEYFPAGTNGVVIPDADVPGQKLMRLVAGQLQARGCFVRWIDLGYQIMEAHGKDISDWLNAGHNADELKALITATAEWKPTADKSESTEEVGETEQSDQGEEIESDDSSPAATEILAECHGPEWIREAKVFLHAPQHGTAADLLHHAMRSSVVAERITLNESNRFFRRATATCYSIPFSTIRTVSRLVLEKAVDDALDAEKPLTQGQDIKDLYSQAGKATAKARTRDFIAGALAFFSDMVLVEPSIPWNATREAIPTLTDVLDFSGPQLAARPARKGEYFRDPAPCTAQEILEAKDAPRFRDFIEALFADELTRRSAVECAATCISGVPRKLFYVWNNPEGDGGKNTFFDFLSRLVPERIVAAKNALILYRGESGERRFGESIMRGRTGIGFDEVGGAFDVAQIKRYLSLSGIRVEDKGEKSITIEPTWVMVALCNTLPRFYPDDDWAFLSRVFVLPFSSVFWKDIADYNVRISQGISPARLKPAKDKDVLVAELLEERPAIIAILSRTWISMRSNGGNPFESPECRKAKEAYRSSNDAAERFFNEYLQRDDNARIEYSLVKAAWVEFTGDPRPAMRDVVSALIRRFPFISKARGGGGRQLQGIRFKDDMEPKPPDPEKSDNDLPFDEKDDPDQEVKGDPSDRNHDFLPRERENDENLSRVEKAVLGHSGHLTIPEDLAKLSKDEVRALGLSLYEYVNGPPPHPEAMPEYERVTAELGRREGGSA